MPLFRCPRFLSGAECAAIRHAMDLGTQEAAEVLSSGLQTEPAVRKASLVEPAQSVIDLIENRLDSVHRALSSAMSLELGDREGPGFIRYPAGGFYRPHRDRGIDGEWPDAARRAVSVVIFLNSSGRLQGGESDFDGGVLRLFLPDGEDQLVPETGLLVAFPSEVLHEVTQVTGGTRDTVVDWFYFKEPEQVAQASAVEPAE